VDAAQSAKASAEKGLSLGHEHAPRSKGFEFCKLSWKGGSCVS
jgi:hypothetical protein